MTLNKLKTHALEILLVLLFTYLIWTLLNIYANTANQEILAVSDLWIDAHGLYYVAAPLLGFFSLFLRVNIIYLAPAALIISKLTYDAIFFEKTHDILRAINFYNWIGYPEWAANPQLPILLFYAITLVASFALLAKRAFKSFGQIFVIILLLVNLAVVTINHASFPGGFMKDVYREHQIKLENYTELNTESLKRLCTEQNLNCRVAKINSTPEVLFEFKENDAEMLSYYKEVSTSFPSEDYKIVANHNKYPSLYIVKKHDDNSSYEIFSVDTPRMYWTLSLTYFSRASFWVSIGWFYFSLALAYIHRKRGAL